MSAPDHNAPRYFRVCGMAAALRMWEEPFKEAYRSGEVAPPDLVENGEPLWSFYTFSAEVEKSIPADVHGTGRIVWVLTSLLLAEHAEGLHT
jgi:hypothetical protein